MKLSQRKKLEKAVNFIREVFDDLENEGQEDFDNYGARLDTLATELYEILEDESSQDDEDVEDGFQIDE